MIPSLLRDLFKPGINSLAVFIPIAFLMGYVPALRDDLWLFVAASLAMVVCSAWIANATDSLADVVGPTWGGMMNAAFGNLPELIFGLIAVSKGLGELAKAAWVGAVIGNVLTVIGSAMLVAGLKFGTVRFPSQPAGDACNSLIVAVLGLFLPTIYIGSFARLPGQSAVYTEQVSLCVAALLLLMYVATLAFTFVRSRSTAEAAAAPAPAPKAETGTGTAAALGILAGSSVLIAFLSGFVADSVDAVKSAFGLTDLFVGVIVIGTIGNVAAIWSAVKAAGKNRMELAYQIGMSAGSQIILLVVPLLVFASRLFGHPVDLHFSQAELASLFGAALLVARTSSDGETNWLNGLQLLILYALIAGLFFFLPGG